MFTEFIELGSNPAKYDVLNELIEKEILIYNVFSFKSIHTIKMRVKFYHLWMRLWIKIK